jgi:indole-3-glycerol phosphate synthase
VQANRAWTPPTGPLGRLSQAASARAQALLAQAPELRAAARDRDGVPSFTGVLARPHLAVIAEVKRRSPSKGIINAGLDAAAQARAYASGGAAALSILTEPAEFGGSVDDLVSARLATNLPTLKKDFHVHPIQAVEARAAGASAMLLIARALAPDHLRAMADAAAENEVEILVEIRSEAELEDALAIEATVIGVNARDLETLVLEPSVTERLIRMIPSDRIAIAESGVAGRADVERVAALGADAVLVGSSISASADATAAVAALTGVPRRARGG